MGWAGRVEHATRELRRYGTGGEAGDGRSQFAAPGGQIPESGSGIALPGLVETGPGVDGEFHPCSSPVSPKIWSAYCWRRKSRSGASFARWVFSFMRQSARGEAKGMGTPSITRDDLVLGEFAVVEPSGAGHEIDGDFVANADHGELGDAAGIEISSSGMAAAVAPGLDPGLVGFLVAVEAEHPFWMTRALERSLKLHGSLDRAVFRV